MMKIPKMNGLAVALAILVVGALFAFRNPDPVPVQYEYMHVTTVESIIPGGLGRSRMFLTNAQGKMDEWKMKNLYSLVGINMGNINENDAQILGTIQDIEAMGFELFEVSPAVQSPGFKPDGSSGDGIYLTRYLFRRPKG